MFPINIKLAKNDEFNTRKRRNYSVSPSPFNMSYLTLLSLFCSPQSITHILPSPTPSQPHFPKPPKPPTPFPQCIERYRNTHFLQVGSCVPFFTGDRGFSGNAGVPVRASRGPRSHAWSRSSFSFCFWAPIGVTRGV